MGQVKLVRFHTVVTRQEPAGEPFLDIMQAIAGRRLGRLHQKGLYIFLQVTTQLASALEFLLQNAGFYTISGACDLNECPPGTIFGAHENWKTDYAVDPDDADLDGVSVFKGHHNRSNSIFQEVGIG